MISNIQIYVKVVRFRMLPDSKKIMNQKSEINTFKHFEYVKFVHFRVLPDN